MKYLLLKIEIIATSLILALIVIFTAPTKSIALWWDLEFFDERGEKVGDGEFRYDLNSDQTIKYKSPLKNESIVINLSYDYTLLSECIFHNAWQLKRVSFGDFIWWQTQFAKIKISGNQSPATLVSVRNIQPHRQRPSQSNFSNSTFVKLPLTVKPHQVVTSKAFKLDFYSKDESGQPQKFGGTWTANLREGDINQLEISNLPKTNSLTESDLMILEPLAVVSLILTTIIGIFLRQSSTPKD